MTILIAGYAYVRENFFATFRRYPAKENLFFLLPTNWPVQRGKIHYQPPRDHNIFTARAYFHHSHYPLIGGLLKGWLPAFPLVAWRLKHQQHLRLVYSPSEPILLTTLYQALWSKLFGLRYIFFSWENIPYQLKLKGVRGAIQKIILKLNIVLSDGIICGNSQAFAIFSALTKKTLAQIPLSGLDPDYFQPVSGSKRFRHLALDGKLVFSFVGAVGWRKGVHRLVEAFQKLLPEFPNSFLIIAGSGEAEGVVQTLTKQFGLGEAVACFPWLEHDQLKQLLAASDVFVYPSLPYQGWAEQFGYALAEAGLMELPVITTLSGSISDVVQAGQTGLLVKPDDPLALLQAMRQLAADPVARKKLGANGRRFIVEHFSQSIVARQFYNFFSKFQ